jgi:nucleotide-binding universal stress UspA family protein
MFERIMVPLDGSSAAEIALPYAAEIAEKLGSEIILTSVSEHLGAETDHLYGSYLEREAEQLKRQLKDWGSKEEAKVKTQVLLGKPATEIVRYAEENNVGLITMASRGRSSPGPWLLGNIAAKVLRATGKPVLLVRVPCDTAAFQQRTLLKRILVPLDGSPLGEAAIPHAEALARAFGAEIVLFRAFLTSTFGEAYDYRSTSLSNFEEQKKQLTASTMAYLNSLEKACQNKGLIASSMLREGRAADGILEYAEANRIDLIAMSTHGRSDIGRWVLGSVTDKVLHAGNTAVLTVRATRI